MIDRKRLRTLGLGLFVILCWALYFVICSAPTGAPFIYADF
jgi:hypothetical protein